MTGGTYDVGEASSYSCGVKVHHSMCKEMKKSVDRITHILPAIESAQPNCRAGIDALCSLNLALEKANLLIQHCTESSKLYLVITGDVIKLRCQKVHNSFGQSLSQIQSMVPLLLAAQISAIVDDLKGVNFVVESSEEAAGQVMQHLLRQASNSSEAFEFEAFQIAVLRLQLTSSKALLIEKRSIKKLLGKVRDTDQAKERILKYLLYLLGKYGQSIADLRTVNSTKGESLDTYTISSGNDVACKKSIKMERDVGSVAYDVQADISCKLIPPDEFKCPISLRLMHDPVVIASGQTFERVRIEKWFEEGHNTCPKTQQNLSHLCIIPNSGMKDLISKWCKKHGISIPDPSLQPIPTEVYQWNTSSSSSIASLSSSLNNVHIQLDDVSVSFGSPDVSSVASELIVDSLVSHQTGSSSDRYGSPSKFSHGMDSSDISKLGELPWESQCRIMEDVRNYLDDNQQACDPLLCPNFVQTLVRFFKDASDRSDVNAQRIGARVLQIYVTKSRNEVASVYEDIFYLVFSFLDSEIIEEALEVIEVLSGDECCILEVMASAALPSILKIVESPNRELQIPALRILCNLSSQSNIGTQIVDSGCIPKLISLLGDRSLAPHCISVLKNLCVTCEGRLAVGEASEFVASVVELLETGDQVEQEHGVSILLSLCSHRIEYCEMVLKEGAIPSLVTISINGNAKGKDIAMELLRLLRDIIQSDSQASLPATQFQPELSCESINFSTEKQSLSKTPGYFRRKINFFTKSKSILA